MIKKTRVYLALGSLFAMSKMLFSSLCASITGRDDRQFTDRLAQTFADDILSAVSATLTVKGQLPTIIPGRSYILLSNHSSHFDIPAIYGSIPLSIRMIAKKELYDIPFFGSALHRHEFIKMDRQNRERAMIALQEAKKLMESGIVVWAAPEGTRSRTGELLPFKKGIFMLAIDAEAILIPVAIQGTRHILPAKTWRFAANQHVTVSIGQPIDTRGMNPNARDQLMSDVRAQLEHMLKENC